MSIAATRKIHCGDSAATEKLAEAVGSRLKGGEVIELISDLGGGKTTFARGLTRGAGSKDHVASPTFTLARVYKTDKFEIHHFDFYRLADAGLIQHELADIIGDPDQVTVIEWGAVVSHVLPDERLRVEFKPTAGEARDLTIHCPQSLSYLVENL